MSIISDRGQIMKTAGAALSRRDFLKLGGLGFLGLFLPFDSLFQDAFDAQQGRVTTRLIWLYDKPSFDANRVKMYWRDSVLPISNITVSDDLSAYNRVWYEIGDQGYAYSGTLQPVQTILNTPTSDIPRAGLLGEVSVPYTDAHEQANGDSPVAYRMYYETVHWVMSARANPADGRIWYQVLDDKWNKLYYVPGEHIRLMSKDELTPISPEVPDDLKKIQVRLSDQLVFAYEKDSPVFAARAATGGTYRDGTYTTPSGSFMTYHKRPTRHMAAGDLTASGFDLPGVPWVMYITESGISLHGTFWHNDFGHPRSHGCVNLSPSAAKWLFRWTRPVVGPGEQLAYKPTGTLVEIVK
jgi:lipoprotein-anchoring transpeptidase ErfK/SrfK